MCVYERAYGRDTCTHRIASYIQCSSIWKSGYTPLTHTFIHSFEPTMDGTTAYALRKRQIWSIFRSESDHTMNGWMVLGRWYTQTHYRLHIQSGPRTFGSVHSTVVIHDDNVTQHGVEICKFNVPSNSSFGWTVDFVSGASTLFAKHIFDLHSDRGSYGVCVCVCGGPLNAIDTEWTMDTMHIIHTPTTLLHSLNCNWILNKQLIAL